MASQQTDDQRAAQLMESRYQRVLAEVQRATRNGHAVRMREVASRAHVSMTTIYQMWTSKDRLVAEALTPGVDREEGLSGARRQPATSPAVATPPEHAACRGGSIDRGGGVPGIPER